MFGAVGVGVSSWLNRLIAGPRGGAPTAFAGHATLSEGLVSYWALNELSGTRYDSVTATGNDLTDNNTVTYVNEGPNGTVAVFVNANNEVLTNATNVMSADSNFTAVAWTRLRSAATGHSNELFTTGDGDFILRCNGEYPQIVGRGFADSTYWNGGAAIPVEQWKMLTGWHDADNNQFGISVDNGVRTTVASGGANGAGTAIAVGARDSTPTDTTETDGDISRVGCWTRVLTAEEQNTLFNGGVGLRYSELPAGLLVGLVSYWDLDEISGARYDSHGANDLTDNNTVGSVNSGPEGVVASFVAANSEYLSHVDDGLGLSIDGDHTFTAWVYRDTAGANLAILSQRTSGDGSYQLYIDTADKLHAYVTDSASGYSEPATAATVPPDQWSFCVLTYTASDKKARVSFNLGTEAAGAALTNGPLATTQDFNISRLATSVFGDSRIARVGTWTRVLPAAELETLFNSGSGKRYDELTDAEKVGLVSYWDLTETSGTRSDSHGTNHLTDNNTVTYAINKGGASEGVGASFVEGNSEALSRADASLVNWPHGDFHLSMWVNTGASTAGHMASKRDGAGAREWRLSTNTSGGAAGDRAYLTASSNGTDEDITLNTGDDSLPPGVWGFVEVEREGTTWKVATNGNAYVTGGSAFFNGEAPFQLGCVNATQALFFTGQIDEVGLWNRVLTSQERTDLFNAGRGLFYGDAA